MTAPRVAKLSVKIALSLFQRRAASCLCYETLRSNSADIRSVRDLLFARSKETLWSRRMFAFINSLADTDSLKLSPPPRDTKMTSHDPFMDHKTIYFGRTVKCYWPTYGFQAQSSTARKMGSDRASSDRARRPCGRSSPHDRILTFDLCFSGFGQTLALTYYTLAGPGAMLELGLSFVLLGLDPGLLASARRFLGYNGLLRELPVSSP